MRLQLSSVRSQCRLKSLSPCGKRLTFFGILLRASALQKSSGKLAIAQSRKCKRISRGILHDSRAARLVGGLTYLAIAKSRVTPAHEVFIYPRASVFIKYLTFRYLRRNFSPAGYGEKKIDIIELHAVGCTLQRAGSYITFNIPVPARTKIFPAAHCSRAREPRPTLIIPDENSREIKTASRGLTDRAAR